MDIIFFAANIQTISETSKHFGKKEKEERTATGASALRAIE
jgi:hypothetical protein